MSEWEREDIKLCQSVFILFFVSLFVIILEKKMARWWQNEMWDRAWERSQRVKNDPSALLFAIIRSYTPSPTHIYS